MTDWTNILNGSIDPDSPVTQALMTALRDNPIALLEGATGAPINQFAWHPYDAVTVGDGADGIFWDHALTGDAGAINSPDFEDGYEYEIQFLAIDHDDADPNNIELQLYRETTAAYTSAQDVATGVGAGVETNGWVRVLRPRIAKKYCDVDYSLSNRSALIINLGVSQKVLRARFDLLDGDFSGGQMALWRRRVYE